MKILTFLARVIASIIRRIRHRFAILLARKSSTASLYRRTGNNILVICYGNIYRSPLAEFLLNRNCTTEIFSIRSAGFHNKKDRICDHEYLHILKEYGYDLSNHRSKVIDPSDIKWADIIIIMDRYNWDLLRNFDRDSIRKTVWIGAFSQLDSVEVKDPYGEGVAFTKNAIRDIELCIKDICTNLVKLQTESNKSTL